MNYDNFRRGISSCTLLLSLATAGLAQDQGKDEVERLKGRIGDLESAVQELRSGQQQGLDETDESFDEMDEQLLGVSRVLSELKLGKRKLLVTGYAFGGFRTSEAQDSTFFAGFVPIFLWKPSENTLLEAEVEFELEDGETLTEIEYVQMSYIFNDYVTVGFGKFLNPANPFANRLHPAWINKLPDAPLAFGARRIMPFTQLGMQIHGGVPVGSQKINYSLYVSNGSTLEEEDTNYGVLEEENFTDTNNNKAVGGRVGYFPMPELEIGYSFQFSQATASASEAAKADVSIQSVDLNYVTSVAEGTLDVRAQWAFSDVDNVTFDPTGAEGFGPVRLNNKRDGGYVQAAFRPSGAEGDFLNNLEGVVRYDEVDLPSGAPEGTDESRLTFGLNYWLSASSVFKLAYQSDNTDSPAKDSDALMFQWAIGF